jgi:hypothetical protein
MLPQANDPFFDWADADAKCTHTLGDQDCNQYGVGMDIQCGGSNFNNASASPDDPATWAPNCGAKDNKGNSLMACTYGNKSPSPTDPPEAINCEMIGKDWVASYDYKDSSGACWHKDWTGQKSIPCGPNTPTLPGGKIPNVDDSDFDWADANAVCYHTLGDLVCGLYGEPSPIICGGNASTFKKVNSCTGQ